MKIHDTTLLEALEDRILLLDGAMGTMIQQHELTEQDYRGERFADWPQELRGNNDLLNLTQPQIISGIHEAFLDAGADIIETNSFNSTSIAQADYGMQQLVAELNESAARLAREAVDRQNLKTPAQPRWVAGVLGPTNRTASLSPDVRDPAFRNVDFEQLVDAYAEAARGLIQGGVDLLMIETVFDTLNARAAMKGRCGKLSISAHREADCAVISICDAGAGMSPELLNEVINPFLEADSPEHLDGQSAVGLGLLACRTIARQHGAGLSARNNDGPGCTFCLSWPAARS